MSPPPADKRSSLIQSASKLTHQFGFNRTTLAEIAADAGVPLGNVYYYFRTKEAIGEALIEQRVKGVRAQLETLDCVR